MDYQKAQRIRGQSLSDLIAETIASGGGIGQSIKSGISQKTQAKMTGMKQTLDPMNVAKFMTGGSNLAPALLGRLTGRSKKDIQFFTGKSKNTDTASKIKPLEKGNEFNDVLMRIYSLMASVNDANTLRREEANQFAEENSIEKARRHKELMEAISGKRYTGDAKKITATKVAENAESSLLDDLLAAFGLGSSGMTILKSLGTFLVSPLGLALVGGTLTVGLLYKLLKNDPNPEQTTQMIQDAGSPDAAVGREIMDVTENTPENAIQRKKMNILAGRPSDKKSMVPWKDSKLQEDYLKTIGWDEKTGTIKAERDTGVKSISVEGKPVSSSPAPVSKPTEATVTPPASQKLNQVQSENLNLNIPESKQDPSSVINNTSVKKYAENGKKIPMPSVRNLEPTFQNMILYSTRVV